MSDVITIVRSGYCKQHRLDWTNQQNRCPACSFAQYMREHPDACTVVPDTTGIAFRWNSHYWFLRGENR